jgi:hypothetical protein
MPCTIYHFARFKASLFGDVVEGEIGFVLGRFRVSTLEGPVSEVMGPDVVVTEEMGKSSKSDSSTMFKTNSF